MTVKETCVSGRLGQSHPLGATVIGGGVNFCVYSSDASSVELLLFHYEDDVQPEVITLDPSSNRTYHYWHTFVPSLYAAQLIAIRFTERLIQQWNAV